MERKKVFVHVLFTILIFCSIAFIGNNCSETVIILLNKWLAMLFGDIGPLFANYFQIGGVSCVPAVNLNFQGFPQIFDGIQVRRSTWPLQNLNILLSKINSWTDLYKCSWRILRYFAPINIPLITWNAPVPPEEKHPHAIILPPPSFTACRYDILESISAAVFPPNMTRWVFAKQFDFSFIWQYNTIPKVIKLLQIVTAQL